MFSIKKMGHILSLSACLFLLTNCASTSKSSSEKDTAAKTFATSDSKGVVYLYRPSSAISSALQAPIKINGTDAGGTGPGTYFRWELEPGTYAISTSSRESSAVVELDVKPGKLYFVKQEYKIDVVAGSKVAMEESDEAAGKKAVQKCKLLISTYVK